MKYAVKVGSGAMIHIPSLIKFGSAIPKFRGDIWTHIQHAYHISILSFFKIWEVG
jgi:hypothetical protein